MIHITVRFYLFTFRFLTVFRFAMLMYLESNCTTAQASLSMFREWRIVVCNLHFRYSIDDLLHWIFTRYFVGKHMARNTELHSERVSETEINDIATWVCELLEKLANFFCLSFLVGYNFRMFNRAAKYSTFNV